MGGGGEEWAAVVFLCHGIAAGLTTWVSLAAFAGSSRTPNSSLGYSTKSLLSRSLVFQVLWLSVGLSAQLETSAPGFGSPGWDHFHPKGQTAPGLGVYISNVSTKAGDEEFRASLDYIGIPCLNKSNTTQTPGYNRCCLPACYPTSLHTTPKLNLRRRKKSLAD